MKILSLLYLLSFNFTVFCASNLPEYHSVDPKNPIQFKGDHIIYAGKTIFLGPKAFFIDGQLSDKQCENHPYVFSSINEAVKHIQHGTESAPMNLYIAPWVYWIDNPDSPEIRVPGKGQNTPYGLELYCPWLSFIGLNPDARNVVLACNRGQTIGAKGNFTMFKIMGDGIRSENITFGNYCNVDLNFPLKPSLNRGKRAEAIVQAQLIHCNGDKIYARNTRFISRLNLCPFVGGKRTLFDSCHFELTDDALAGSAVYLICTLTFFSPKPFYHTTGTGAVFLNCYIRSFSGKYQYFTKANGQLVVVDTRISSESVNYVGWNIMPPVSKKNYQFNFQLNGEKYCIDSDYPATTVQMENLPLLNAYRIENDGEVIYNTYNLLMGDDNWDPMGVAPLIQKLESKYQKSFIGIPVRLELNTNNTIIETNKKSTVIHSQLFRFGNYPVEIDSLNWFVSKDDSPYVRLLVDNERDECKVVALNNTDSVRKVVVTAKTKSGLEAACLVEVFPEILEAPHFSEAPTITMSEGVLNLQYSLATNYADQTNVSWYRSTSKDFSEAIEVKVSRFNNPLKEYKLTKPDVGYYLMATVSPKHIRSNLGDTVIVIYPQAISINDIRDILKSVNTTFRHESTKNDNHCLPGFWIMKDFVNEDTRSLPHGDAWFYDKGKGGAINHWGLISTGRQGRLFYTPIGDAFGNMHFALELVPYKTAGQGFSIADLYIDLLIKFDVETQSGYALRFIRTTKHHNAVDCFFVEYKNGATSIISDIITTSCYRSVVNVTIDVIGNKLIAKAQSDKTISYSDNTVLAQVKLEAEFSPNINGGFGVIFNGGSPTLIKSVKASWQ